MKKILICLIILFFLLTAGCSTVSNSNTENANQNIGNTKRVGNIVVSVDHVEIVQEKSYLHEITIFMTAENKGKTALSLSGYTNLVDYAGVSNTGTGLYFELMYPGEKAESSTVFLISDSKRYDALLKGATLSVWFIDSNKNTFDGSFIVDING